MDEAFDPRFQRPRLKHCDVRRALAALEKRTGILHADRAEWMIDGIIEGHWGNLGAGPTITAWKNYDRLLSVDEKRARGINTRYKICERLADTLTELGTANLNLTLTAIFMAPIEQRARERPGATVAREFDGSADSEVERLTSMPQRFTAVDDSRTCPAAKAIHKAVFRPEHRPEIPLATCTAIHCRCSYMPMGSHTLARWLENGQAYWHESALHTGGVAPTGTN